MSKPEERGLRCSYYDALAAIGLMKGVPMIDVARDDALISALMDMNISGVVRIVARYDRESLGYPTPEKVATLADACGAGPAKPACVPEPEPRRCVQTVRFRSRLLGLFWALVTAVVTSLVVAWITGEPSLNPLVSHESRPQPDGEAAGSGWHEECRRGRPCQGQAWKRRVHSRR